MRREDINRIFEGATDEQVKALLDINSADITKALGKQKGDGEKLQADLDAANAALADAKSTIANLEAAKGDADKLQKELDEYKAADEKRKAEEKAAAERAELMERMDAVLGDKQFIHDRMRDIVAEDFKAALADKANRGKGDAEIFEAITRDQGYFKTQNPPAPNMPTANPVNAFAGVTDRKSFLKLSGTDQARFKAEHAAEFYSFFPEFNKNN